ncbi:MAG: sugar kinase [Oscillospiraceae bacterium]|jgi:NAD kinase|nr:sugar kinase [Oscillospiraceae bacterium]
MTDAINLSERKVILIKRRTRLEDLIARYNTAAQAKFYIEHMGSDFSDYLAEDAQYKSVLRQAEDAISALARLHVVDREHLPNFIFGQSDIVVAVGQDGLVANTLKYLSGQPLVGVNPDNRRWDGVLLPFEAGDLGTVLPEVAASRRPVREITMAKVTLNDGQELYAVNDLFIGQKTHVSARYSIQISGKSEEQSSSGIIVSTGLGASGWLKSIVEGASHVAGAKSRAKDVIPAQWDAESLQYTVREPFPSRSTGSELVFGQIARSRPLIVVSHMPENGVIFSDGIENDALEFRSGIRATVGVADKKGVLVV